LEASAKEAKKQPASTQAQEGSAVMVSLLGVEIVVGLLLENEEEITIFSYFTLYHHFSFFFLEV
jgi:hypothetical protein